MGSSLRRKKRAKAAAGKKTHKVGVKTNLQTGKARIDTGAVELPGAGCSTAVWDVETTLTKNYAASGLVSDPNATGKGGRNTETTRASSKGKVAARATSDGDETRSLLGQTRSTGYAAPKRLTPKQTRVISALVEAHGDDLDAMVLDRKRNAYQHTRGVLLRMVESYHYYERERAEGGMTRVDFRAPIKGKL